MSETAWTWFIFLMELVGIAGLYNAGKRHWWGWALVLASAIPWFVYAVLFNKPGFAAMSLLWISVHTRNTVKWYRDRHFLRETRDSDTAG